MARQSQSKDTTAPARWTSLAVASGYDVQTAASAERMSRRQLHRLCRRELGVSVKEWFRMQRVEAGRRWLLATRSVKRAAWEAGFRQVSHFSREFKRVQGLTPTEFILRHGGEAPPVDVKPHPDDVLRR